MEYKYIKLEKEGFKGILTLNRPQKRNAFTPTMVNEIDHAFDVVNNDDQINLVLIKAEGPIFCAGMDLKTFENPDLDVTNPLLVNQNISLGEVFDKLHKPSIALVEGNVIAGGFLIILGCTYVFCKPEVQFRLPELGLGIFPFQVMASLLKVIPEKKVLQLCIETDYFNMQKALSLDIVDGYMNTEKIEALISTFKDVNPHVLKAGFSAIRDLADIPKKEHFAYLKTVLDAIKN